MAVGKPRDQREHHRGAGHHGGDQRTVMRGEVGNRAAHRRVAAGHGQFERVVALFVKLIVTGQRGEQRIRRGQARLAVRVKVAVGQIGRQLGTLERAGEVALEPAVGDIDGQRRRVGSDVVHIRAEFPGLAEGEFRLAHADDARGHLFIDAKAFEVGRDGFRLGTGRRAQAGEPLGGVVGFRLGRQVHAGLHALVHDGPRHVALFVDGERREMGAAVGFHSVDALGDEGDGAVGSGCGSRGFAGIHGGGHVARGQPGNKLAISALWGRLQGPLAAIVVVPAFRRRFPGFPDTRDAGAGVGINQGGGRGHALVRSSRLLQFADCQHQGETGVAAGGRHRLTLAGGTEAHAGQGEKPHRDDRQENHQREGDNERKAPGNRWLGFGFHAEKSERQRNIIHHSCIYK